MKNLSIICPLTFILLLTMSSCKDKKSSIYENCCGTAPTADSVQLSVACDGLNQFGRVYIANIFIPDTTASGATDWPDENLFLIHGNEYVVEVTSLELTNDQGDVLYRDQNFEPNLAARSWRGTLKDGSYYFGSFNYQATVRFCDGQTKTYTGAACAFQCNEDGFPSDNFPDCFFPGQNDGNARPLKDIPAPEICF